MTEETQEEKFSRGMVVVAHADDAEYGCSGTVAKWCSEGWEVVYVMCTDGSKGSSDREMAQKELLRIRRQEQTNAGKVLGLKDVAFLDHEDGMLVPTLELRRDIAREIRRYRPDVVICQLPIRVLDGEWRVSHPDHMAAGEATLAAVFPSARDHLTFPELLEAGFEPHKVAEIWIMGHPAADLWVDVTDHMDTSVKALMQHESQTNERSEEDIGEMMRKWRRRTAEGKGMQYAEAFKRISYRR
jgi:LmbE family N-acetylglucosaminyl deacetylase